MSLKQLAQQVAHEGRYGDTELVHVSKDELRALHGLAGIGRTRITTNPTTGLPEAFNLGRLLPIIGGVAGSFMGAPWLGAALSGVATAANTGSLEKGLMAGMGSYALGGLGSSLAGAGGNALAGAATEAGGKAAIDAGTQSALEAAVNTATQNASQATPEMLASAGLGGGSEAITQGAVQQALSGALNQNFPNLTSDQLGALSQAQPGMPGFDQVGESAGRLNALNQFNVQPPSMWDKLQAGTTPGNVMNWAANNPGQAIAGGMTIMDAFSPTPKVPGQGGGSDSVLSRATLVPDYYSRNSTEEAHRRLGYAGGGLARLHDYACGGPVAFNGGGIPRLLKGEGDGMSDSIPAKIDGRQDAALSTDEFVVPADLVSAIGNGSSEAGAKRLYEMMDKIRTYKYGRKTQPPEIEVGVK